MRWIDRLPVLPLALGAAFMLLAPFVPEPHLLRDVRWLLAGELTRPADVFDLAWHLALPVLLTVRLFRKAQRRA